MILDGEAQFTIDGRTSVLKGPAGAPCRMGHSHAIYNASDKPVQWMNINVSMLKGAYDNFDLGDDRHGAPLDPIPVFMTMRLDRSLLRPASGMSGGHGRSSIGACSSRRSSLHHGPMWTTCCFRRHFPWPHLHREVAEFYYVMSGQGEAKVAAEGGASDSAPIRAGDAIPIQLNDVHSFENTGSEPLEFMIVGVSRDGDRKIDSVDVRN